MEEGFAIPSIMSTFYNETVLVRSFVDAASDIEDADEATVGGVTATATVATTATAAGSEDEDAGAKGSTHAGRDVCAKDGSRGDRDHRQILILVVAPLASAQGTLRVAQLWGWIDEALRDRDEQCCLRAPYFA